ncbi:Uncharacterised protein [Burkholderia pseudomallei]|uniref:DUF6387 family protein n=1 Tax=Burkholderia pseudomallei TaxID=28450 RepID=UPI000F089024|nr:DUF6387 family protein [Burkholderia pseudomallei]AYX27444.1 hypothetical protein EGY16_04135 [Burkholderia pseudomallei]CAJ2853523.1 Uncharacterised protein [Burkholderia pseudomallei]VCH03167.1 Uncharacterised protein [Burkholderia pseudomallei]VCH27391.1 Uncharacterised protein [Burkholderia pseudomallei]VCH32314.1 Uncharacterised protein [Burkholderia pseudomallei]
MEKIEFGRADLPPQFDLTRYRTCETWGASEWWHALAQRYRVRLFSTLTPEEMAEDEDNPDLLKTLQAHSLAFLENPLPITEGERRPFPAFGLDSPIRDLTGTDYYDGLLKLNSAWYEGSAALARRALIDNADGVSARTQLANTPAWSIHREAGEPSDKFWIEVNLTASDESLVKEFKAWLKRLRKEAGIPQIPKAFDESHFADWHEKRLLPYLDLTLWAHLHGGPLNLSALGDALFPDEAQRGAKMRDVEPMIRRTTAPRARALMSLETIATLNRQVWPTA